MSEKFFEKFFNPPFDVRTELCCFAGRGAPPSQMVGRNAEEFLPFSQTLDRLPSTVKANLSKKRKKIKVVEWEGDRP